MYYKRPAFKRGGPTGIAQLTNRVHAKMGFPNFGVSRNADGQPNVLKMRSAPSGQGLGNFFKGLAGPRYTDENYVSPFLKPDAPFFSTNTGFGFMKPGGSTNAITRTAETPIGDVNIYDDDQKGMFSGVTEGRFVTMDDGRITDTNTGETVTQEDIEIIKRGEPRLEPKEIEKPLTGELSMKDAISDEVDVLKDLLKSTGMSKGEKALLLAKVVGTPGSIKDKLDVGGDLALKELQEQKKQDKAIILTAYKSYKATELANGKKNDKQKQVETYVTLKRQAGDKRPQRDLELEAIEVVYKPKTIETPNPNQEVAKANFMQTNGIGRITELQETIQKFKGSKIRGAQEKINAANAELKKLVITMKLAGMEDSIKAYGLTEYLQDGGRVKRAIGTPETGETDVSVVDESIVTPTGTEKIEATEVTAAENVEPMQEVPVMDFSTLRNRLPKEVTDDIVQLLANSKEALQDFYYLTNQQDVGQFNTKYGVNLILPPSVLA